MLELKSIAQPSSAASKPQTGVAYTRESLPASEWIKLGSLVKVPAREKPLGVEEILAFPADRPRFRRILFIAPRPHGYDVPPAPTPSFGYLGEAISAHGFEWRLLDLRLGGGLSEVRAAIREFRPDVIGYTFQFTIGAKRCMEFLHQIRRTTDLPIVIGGAHLTIRGHNILEEAPGILAAVQKEGEYPLLAILKGVPLGRIPNLWIREGNLVIETPHLGYVGELDSLPWPRYPGYDLQRFAHVGQVDVLTSRGCPFLCTFCSVALTQGRRFRTRSPENVVQELRYWYDRGIRLFNFIDDILTVNKKRFHDVLDRIQKERFEGVTLSCTQGMRADACDLEMLQKMKDVGFEFLGFGVESGSERMLETIKKGETLEEIDAAISNACKVGFEVGLFFIIGMPNETAEDVEKSFAFAFKHPVMYARFHACVPYPGTELAKWVDENSSWYVRPEVYLNDFSYHDGQVVFDCKGMPLPEHRRYLRRAYAVDAEVRRRYAVERMVRNGTPRIIASPASRVFYNPLYFNKLRRFVATNKLGASIKNVVSRVFNLQTRAHTGMAAITFNSGK